MIEQDTKKINWRSPSNIALIKYWGKFGNQLPSNPSISFSLSKAYTETSIEYSPKKQDKGNINFTFEGKEHSQFKNRIVNFISKIENILPSVSNYDLTISSANSFPHSTGIASSASAMSALSLCLCSIEKENNEELENIDFFFQQASIVSRIGSGSASRSVFSGFVSWGESKYISKSSNNYAQELRQDIHPLFQNIQDSIIIIDASPKKVSSSQGHALMDNHPYAQVRFEQARKHIGELLNSLESGEINKFIEIVENEAMSLHALMMNSTPSYTLLHPNTLIGIERIRTYRETKGIPVCFTLDAGPNLHILYPVKYKREVKEFINRELLELSQGGQVLHDNIGQGPEIINA